jgi:hypothetical protein
MTVILAPDDNGIPAPAKTPHDLRLWAAAQLTARQGAVLCSARDFDALASILPGRVAVPERGKVQPGTVWLEK